MAKENFLNVLKQRVQTFKRGVDNIPSKPSIPGDMGLKTLVEEFAAEFSMKSPGFFPGQIGPKKLIDYHNRFTQFVPGYGGVGRVNVHSNYSREVTQLVYDLFSALYKDLQNPNVEIPWLLDKLGSLFIRGGTVATQLSHFLDERMDNIRRALAQ